MRFPEEHRSLPTRLSLLERLRLDDDPVGWEAFYDRYGRLIRGVALKAGLTEAEADDVMQETCLSVARQMPDFSYDPARGSFKAWLLRITRCRIADQFRKRPAWSPANPWAWPARPAGAHGDGSGNRTPTVERLAAPDDEPLLGAWDQAWEDHLVHAALRRLQRLTSLRQYQMFDLYVVQRWPMPRVCETLGVNRAQVYMAKMRLTRLFRREFRRFQDEESE